MKIIGLTGGIGSGKSTVAKILKEKYNAFLIITDDVAKILMEPSNISYMKTVEYFGEGILDENGFIDRKKLSQIVFNDEEKLKILNSFSHPYVRKEVEKLIGYAQEKDGYDLIIIETALLFEAKYEGMCDEVWYVSVSEDIRRERLSLSRGYSQKKMDSIISKQLNHEEYKKHCDVVIDNSKDIENVLNQLKLILVK